VSVKRLRGSFPAFGLRIPPGASAFRSTASWLRVSLRIYDIAGRTVRTLVNGRLDAGAHQRVWDGRGDSGQRVAAGIYFYRLDTEQGLQTRRMVMLQ